MQNDTTTEIAPPEKGLRRNALGLVSSVVVGMSSTAPAYSLAATLAFIVMAVGTRTPAILLIAFVPMYLTAVAFRELNRENPDCGTTFAWATDSFGPWVGWMGGWGIIAANVIVMSNLAQIAGSYSFQLVGADSLANSTLWTTVVGVVWIGAMTWICYRGIEVSANVQRALLSIELVVLVLFAVTAAVRTHTGHGGAGSLTPSLGWLWPSHLGLKAISDGVLLAVFLYWGWDTAVACNEETRDATRIPGRAAVISTVLLVATYVLVAFALIAFAGIGTHGIGLGNTANEADVFHPLARSVFGAHGFGHVFELLLVGCVLTSASAATQTTVLPAARTTLSMAAQGALPKRFGNMHARYLTPTYSTLFLGVISAALYVALTMLSANVLADSIAAVGLLVTFHYSLTGLVCAWHYRRSVRTGARAALVRVLMPLVGGLVLLAAFVKASIDYADPSYGATKFFGIGGVFVLGVGSIVLGLVLMVVCAATAPTWFRRGARRGGGSSAGSAAPDLPAAPADASAD
jgi:amino acid transporter